jgi:hypothetical protein
LLEQGDGRLGVDALVEAHDRLQTLQVDGTVDVEPLPTGVGRHLLLLAALDPAAGEHGIVLRMDRVHEVHRVVLALVLHGVVVLDENCSWIWRSALPGTSLGFFL